MNARNPPVYVELAEILSGRGPTLERGVNVRKSAIVKMRAGWLGPGNASLDEDGGSDHAE